MKISILLLLTIGLLFFPGCGLHTNAPAASVYHNLLVIGNSISRAPPDTITATWKGNHGMAASEPEKDFVHLLARKLQERNPNLTFYADYSLGWERNHHNFDLHYFDRLLASDANGYQPDLIIVRLGENVSDLDFYQEDFSQLLEHIKTCDPSARLVVTGLIWKNKAKEDVQKYTAFSEGAEFVSLKKIDRRETKAELGDRYRDIDGVTSEITDKRVATHPNDLGMQEIYQTIYDTVQPLQ